MKYRCLNCNNVWEYYGAKPEGPGRCGTCRSYDVIEEEEYQSIIRDAMGVSEDNPRLRLEVLKAIIRSRGLRFMPLSTINLTQAVLDDVFPEVSVGVTVLPGGSVFYQMKRVKRRRGRE